MMVRRYADSDPKSTVVIGAPQTGPLFPGISFRPAKPARLTLPGPNRAYAAGVHRKLRTVSPELIEVYNRPEIALLLARRCPQTPVSLFLQNDPQHMRRAESARERTALLQKLGGVITASAYLRERFLDGIPGGQPVHVLPNCLDPAELPPLRPPEDRERLILFAGRIVAEKGPDSFLAACAQVLPRLPGWRAEMIGANRFGDNSPESPLLKRLRPEAEAAGVVLAGYRPHQGVLEAMARAAIVVVPSRWPEPFGLVAVEAMACGAALITSRRGALPEIAGDTALYADPEDPAALGAAITSLAQNEDRRIALAAAGRVRARRFSLPEMMEQLRAIRSDILSRWSAPGAGPIYPEQQSANVSEALCQNIRHRCQ
ncbi:MAG: glycosyltransferase family 4 protein [Acetobacteraceae bacterium]|nr:glycosyltransferase family 4 protein [Acetobacteraceae bacterium]